MKTLHRPPFKFLLAALFVLAAASAVHAEKRIGVIMSGDISYYETIHKSFVATLTQKFAGSEKIEIILQKPFPNPISWSNAARKLIAFDMDLIVTYGSPATLAFIDEKSRIPMVYAGVYEPNHASTNVKNVTGCGFKVPLSSILRYFKRLKTIHTLGIVLNSGEEDSLRQYETMRALSAEQNVKTLKIDLRSQSDLDKLQTIQADAVFITGSSLAHLWLEEIVTILDKKQVPVADIFSDDTETGVLMTLYQPPHSQGEIAAEMARQILQGAKPGDIAPHTSRDTELVFNLIEARHLGLNFPIQLLIEATRVIE